MNKYFTGFIAMGLAIGDTVLNTTGFFIIIIKIITPPPNGYYLVTTGSNYSFINKSL